MLANDVVERAQRRVGTTLCGKWQLDCVLGVGGMAAVYAATHRNRNRVAIKMLHPELSIDESIRERFLREGYVANTIDHPGAVRVLDDEVTEDGAAFLVMELLEGENVEQRAARKGGALALYDALDVADQLLDVLAVAHDVGIVHRDIKPDNLFIAQGGQLKVLDFGIARLRQGSVGSTRAGSFMGTPAFSAPEQARGRWNEVDCRTDVFAVGATLFSALTGRPVHEAETPSEQLALAISTAAPRLASVLPDVPDEVAAIVDRALAYDKADRWANAREMQAAVRAVLASLPPGPPLSSPPRRIAAPLVDRSAETLFAEPTRGGFRSSGTTALTTSPATPQALASVRRLVAGVLLAGCTGLIVGLGSWWLARNTVHGVPAAGEQGEVAAARPSEPPHVNVAPSEAPAPSNARETVERADDGGAAPSAPPQGRSAGPTSGARSPTPTSTPRASAPKLKSSDQKKAAPTTSREMVDSFRPPEDPFDNRY